MIKFFRHIRKDLMEKNKTGKYLKYAIGEIILVVIGILIALQVNEWSNQRHQAKAEEIVLTQLQNDLKKSQIELKEVIDVYRGRTKACAIVLRAFWKTETPHDSISKYLEIPGITRVYSPILGTARSLISSGKIDLLSSYELKNDIVSYVEKVDAKLIDIKRHEESYFRKGKELIFEVMPNTYRSKEYYIKSFEEKSPENLKAYFENDFVNIPMDFDKVPFKSDINNLFQNEKFYLAYTKLGISHYNMYLIYGEILVLTNELLEKLDNVTLLKVDNEMK